MCYISPDNNSNVRYKRVHKFLYLRLFRSIFGCIDSALQWYILYTEKLQKRGYVINPCGLCVAKTIIEGKQFTIYWYDDDQKSSHVNLKSIDKLSSDLKVHFGYLVIAIVKKHSFLVMNI